MTELIKYLKSQGIKIPPILFDEKNLDNTTVETFSFSQKDYDNLIFSTIIENLLTFTKKNITPVMYKYFKENSDPTKNLFIQNSVLNFSEFFVDQTVTKNEVKNIVQMLYKDQASFIVNLKKAVELSLIDTQSYTGKTVEGQAIYINSLDQTFISINSNNSYWSLLSFIHELGHAFYNFINKKKKLDVKARINSEISAYNTELDFIFKYQKDDVIKIKSIYFYLSQTLLCAYSLQLTKAYYRKKYLSNKQLDEITVKYIPWEYKHIDRGWELEQIDQESLYYFLARIVALVSHRKYLSKNILNINTWNSAFYWVKNMDWIKYEKI